MQLQGPPAYKSFYCDGIALKFIVHNFILLATKYVHIYLEYICPLVRIGTPQPFSHKRVCPAAPDPKGGGGAGHTRLLLRVWGIRIRTTGEKA
jgi:hypothetical protein